MANTSGRVKNTVRNIFFGYLGTVITALLGFGARKLFILRLSETLLGVNEFYTGILSALSLAELGIGTALNFSLYKPIAENDTETIKSYMSLYKKAYRIIAATVGVIGLAIAPFLPYIVKDSADVSVRDLTLYYLIFLFNSATSYLVAYKYSLVNAQQKSYIQTNITTVTKMVSVTAQIVILFLTSSFYAYLLTDACVQLLQKIVVSRYLDRMYPYLEDKDVKPLSKEQTDIVKEKTASLLWLKIGDTARLQTDSIIITAFIDVATTGLVGNFNMVINTISSFVNTIFNAALPGFGNLIATESKRRQYEMFKVYRFFAVWIYGFSAVGFYILLTPLIVIMYGEQWAMAQYILAWIVLEYYLKGERIVVNNFKTAAGKFEQDKYLAMIQGMVNLIISIVLAIKIGLVGVYIGTVVSGVIANFVRPVIIYHDCFDMKVREYFIDSLKYHIVLLGTLVICIFLGRYTLPVISIPAFVITALMITVIYNVIFIAAFGRSEELKYLIGIIYRRKANK
ncbi:lipopolysaccharide biosynthesis protein [Butyrivibrio sp. TB]|uniref:lipopolysaccharide biosynthesis protein n=1 Tax=Butyrivibrio sp. TB TaxID=1520809 RepID=UPI0008B10942|nr:oligosaccharide flippase family protein [Butyrivibrio sp. TB]SEP95679.1 Membrane protein involved in the export of O-antigen and teichoic acid [Butyrivibrio sp. TB]